MNNRILGSILGSPYFGELPYVWSIVLEECDLMISL